MTKPIIHGENILVPVDELPTGKLKTHKKFIVGHSETGHHHVLESEVDFGVVEDMAKQVFIDVKADSVLVHKKSFDIHDTLTIEPGLYRVVHAVEYDPFAKKLREVWD